jgi:general secretion pathway protein K
MCLKPLERENNRAAVYPPPGEEGVVLLLVLWILALLSVVILSMAQEWRTELKLAVNFQESCRARHLAEAGVYYTLGKLVEAQIAQLGVDQSANAYRPADDWQVSQVPHILELLGDQIEVRITDEAGKIDLNTASRQTLINLLDTMGYQESEIPLLVDSILDWRDVDSLTRLQGAESQYYLGLVPPYPAKNGRFDLVEELRWVRGFGARANLTRLAECLTVHGTGQVVNINAAPQEVLEVIGLSSEQAQALIQARQFGPLRNLAEVSEIIDLTSFHQIQSQINFQASPFFTIMATGIIKDKGVRHTIKALVNIDINRSNPWEIVYWADDYPG